MSITPDHIITVNQVSNLSTLAANYLSPTTCIVAFSKTYGVVDPLLTEPDLGTRASSALQATWSQT
jgi:hypothetical protein